MDFDYWQICFGVVFLQMACAFVCIAIDGHPDITIEDETSHL